MNELVGLGGHIKHGEPGGSLERMSCMAAALTDHGEESITYCYSCKRR